MKLKRFKDNVGSWEDKSTTLTIKKKKIKKYWILIPSLLVLIISLLLIIKIFYFDSHQNDFLFKKYYAIEDLRFPVKRGVNKNVEAFLKYQEKDYSSSSIIFKEILQTDSLNVVILFYYGVSNIEIKNYKEAIWAFRKIINLNSSYDEISEWHLALCYLKTNEKNKSIELFEKISNEENNKYKNLSKNILKKLK